MTDYLVFCSFPAPSADSGYCCSLHTRLVYGYKSGSSGHIVFCFAPCNRPCIRNMAYGSLCNSLDTAAKALHHDAAELAAPVVVFVPDIGECRVFVAFAPYECFPFRLIVRYNQEGIALAELGIFVRDGIYEELCYHSRPKKHKFGGCGRINHSKWTIIPKKSRVKNNPDIGYAPRFGLFWCGDPTVNYPNTVFSLSNGFGFVLEL